MAFDVKTAYADDHAYFDGVESLTLTTQNPSGYAVANVQGVRESVDQSEITAGDFGSEHRRTVFWVWDSTVGDDPKNGDKITDDDSDDWTVLAVSHYTREPRWRLLCVKQVS